MEIAPIGRFSVRSLNFWEDDRPPLRISVDVRLEQFGEVAIIPLFHYFRAASESSTTFVAESCGETAFSTTN
jgi:hypothetical protein